MEKSQQHFFHPSPSKEKYSPSVEASLPVWSCELNQPQCPFGRSLSDQRTCSFNQPQPFQNHGQRPVIHSSNGGIRVGRLNCDATTRWWPDVPVDFEIFRRKVAEIRICGGREVGRLAGADCDCTVSREKKDVCIALFQRTGGSRSGESSAYDQS